MLLITLFLIAGYQGWQSIYGVNAAYSPATETDIRRSIINNASYDPVSRPETLTHIKAGLNIFAIDELNLREQKLTLAGWMTFEWEDTRIMWNQTEHNDLKYIFFKPENIWKPELIIDNALQDLEIIESQALLLRLRYDGIVDWEPPRLFVTHCEIDITFYPYDTQKCAVELLSWSYTIDEVILDHLYEEINLEDFQEHGEWKVLFTEIEDRNLTEHLPDGTLRVYPQLNFWIALQRRTGFYNLNVVMPIVMTSFFVVLVFLVPLDSGEKITYILTEFLALLLLLTIVVPPTSITVSVLALWLGLVLIVAACGILSTVVVLHIAHREGAPVRGTKMFAFGQFMARLLCWQMTTIGAREVETHKPKRITVKSFKPDIANKRFEKKNVQKNDEKDVTHALEKVLKDLKDAEEREITWKFIAVVFDKFCFYAFLLTTIIMNFTFVLALSVVHHYQFHYRYMFKQQQHRLLLHNQNIIIIIKTRNFDRVDNEDDDADYNCDFDEGDGYIVPLFAMIVFGVEAQTSCQDLDSAACIAMAKQNSALCTDQMLAQNACPAYCKLCPLTCYNCNVTMPDVNQCNTVSCANGEVCLLKTSGVGNTNMYSMSCGPKTTCPNGRKRNRKYSDAFGMQSRDTTNSVVCCDSDLCNSPVAVSPAVTTTSTVTTTTSTTSPKSTIKTGVNVTQNTYGNTIL
ncbi:neuronal acetylcholine receptor subunit beta-3-like [Ruditapes philippinarum]|uniref:neuronal acetylcholine receptor subunit beta-3-like n=1 Tax=Ruditapes philippinarum TaxID=129788 RepID=UPI00295AF50E|nr:neuronal acetylcholine receptor subunit beta-3-like [Ruditapes philippinarum]